jgi:RNA polymerase sigma factor (TIGR02999 family)
VDDILPAPITAAGADEPAVADRLFEVLYAELHRIARRQLARAGRNMTLGTTTLLHEAYLDMAARDSVFANRARFMAYACRVMRTLVIDHVRNRKAQKRGGEFRLSSLDVEDVEDAVAAADELARIGGAVDALALIDPLLAQIVDLRFFCGLTFAEIAALRGLSERSVQRHWQKARLYLHGAVQVAGPAQR